MTYVKRVDENNEIIKIQKIDKSREEVLEAISAKGGDGWSIVESNEAKLVIDYLLPRTDIETDEDLRLKIERIEEEIQSAIWSLERIL